MPPHETTSEPSAGAGDAAPDRADIDAPAGDRSERGVVDFRRTARRLRTGLVVVGLVVLATWGVLAVTQGAALRQLAELVGLGLLGTFVVEVVVVGSAAVRGMLAAGERGDRLAAADVSLLPPQLGGRRRR